MKITKYLLEFIIIIILFFFFKLIGKKNASNIGCYIGKKIGPIFRSKQRIKNNLKIVFPNLSKIEEKNIIAKMWCNIGRTFSEYVFLKNFKNDTSHININGLDILDLIIKNKIPTVFVSGHFANFELMAMELERKNLNIAAIYRPLNNFFLNFIMENWRKKFICPHQIPKKIPGKEGDGTRAFIKAAKQSINMAVMVDQSITQGEKINFFNRKAFTTLIPAQLFLKYQYQIVPISIERINGHQFIMDVLPPLNLDINKENEITISEKINKKIENIILKNPSQWIWTHNRWKN